jgi:hypothetical protein
LSALVTTSFSASNGAVRRIDGSRKPGDWRTESGREGDFRPTLYNFRRFDEVAAAARHLHGVGRSGGDMRAIQVLRTLAATLGLALGITAHAAAEPVTFNFEGVFTPTNLNGLTISGFVTYESTSTGPGGVYFDAITALEFTTGSAGTSLDNLYGFRLLPDNNFGTFISVVDNNPSSGDSFVIYSTRMWIGRYIFPVSDPTNPVLVPIDFGDGILEMIWADPDRTMLSSSALPLTPFDISQAENTLFHVVVNGSDYPFDVTSLTRDTPPSVPVPEPASVLLFGLGSAGLILVRRR